MQLRQCPYCKKHFAPSRYCPRQVVCSMEDCQRQRRAAYHRQKIEDDPLYRIQCRDSKTKWRDAHRDYMRDYRALRGLKGPKRPVQALKRLLQAVENNLALRISDCGADVWLVDHDERVKNILASAHLIVLEVLRPPS